VLLVGRTRHAKPGGSITCDKWKNVLATVGTRQRKTEGKDVYCTIRGSTGTMEGNLQAFSPAITCRTLHSQLGYDNLHLADLRHGKEKLLGSGYSRLADLSAAGPGWARHICCFLYGLAAGLSHYPQKGGHLVSGPLR
jgi:hypothetical protein